MELFFLLHAPFPMSYVSLVLGFWIKSFCFITLKNILLGTRYKQSEELYKVN